MTDIDKDLVDLILQNEIIEKIIDVENLESEENDYNNLNFEEISFIDNENEIKFF